MAIPVNLTTSRFENFCFSLEKHGFCLQLRNGVFVDSGLSSIDYKDSLVQTGDRKFSPPNKLVGLLKDGVSALALKRLYGKEARIGQELILA